MDPLIIGSMIFTIIVLVLVGGFALLYPLTRRLAEVLEKRYLADGSEGANSDEDRLCTRSRVRLWGY